MWATAQLGQHLPGLQSRDGTLTNASDTGMRAVHVPLPTRHPGTMAMPLERRANRPARSLIALVRGGLDASAGQGIDPALSRKSKAGRREVPLPPFVVELLAAHRERYPAGSVGEVFTTRPAILAAVHSSRLGAGARPSSGSGCWATWWRGCGSMICTTAPPRGSSPAVVP